MKVTRWQQQPQALSHSLCAWVPCSPVGKAKSLGHSVSAMIGFHISQSKLSKQTPLLKAPTMPASTTLSCIPCFHCTVEPCSSEDRGTSLPHLKLGKGTPERKKHTEVVLHGLSTSPVSAPVHAVRGNEALSCDATHRTKRLTQPRNETHSQLRAGVGL